MTRNPCLGYELRFAIEELSDSLLRFSAAVRESIAFEQECDRQWQLRIESDYQKWRSTKTRKETHGTGTKTVNM